MFLEGFGIKGYRSFGSEIQRVGPLKKINLFIGQNNSGKSNILRFLSTHFHPIIQTLQTKAGTLGLNPLDRHQGSQGDIFGIAIGLDIKGTKCKQIFDKVLENHDTQKAHRIVELLKKVLNSKSMTQGSTLAWFDYEGYFGNVPSFKKTLDDFRKESEISHGIWETIWSVLSGGGGVGEPARWMDWVIRFLNPVVGEPIPSVEFVPAVREIGSAGSSPEDYSGKGIIERLAELQNPSWENLQKKRWFDDINSFLQSVIDDSSARLEIPHDRKMILVERDGLTLPLESLGTGIHEVIILAAAATTLREQIICIEEPELHLHPLLQKKLVRYLNDKTDNQYFITTHSAHLLDTHDAAIFHVRHQDGQTTVENVFSDEEKSQICADLGYRASDILQANCVIWVEGPSDRIYLNHWINSVDSDLLEGVHYSIMFYGGKLLSHLTALDPDDEIVSEFISLRRLNRYMAIVMDSDKESARSRVNKTKMRISSEFKKTPGMVWVTKGREIENYIPSFIIEDVIRHLNAKAIELVDSDDYAHRLHFKTKGKVIKDINKVKVAHEVVKRDADLSPLDLKKRVSELIDFIHSANDFKEE